MSHISVFRDGEVKSDIKISVAAQCVIEFSSYGLGHLVFNWVKSSKHCLAIYVTGLNHQFFIDIYLKLYSYVRAYMRYMC